MEEAIRDEIFGALASSRIPQILGPGKIFYRSALRDTPMPYLCFNVELDPDKRETDVVESGEVLFDIWDYATTNDRTLYIRDQLKKLFRRAHVVNNPALAGTRFFYTGSREAPVENNRSNRRSEDERIYRREVSFLVRGFDRIGAEVLLGDDEETLSGRIHVVPLPQPDGETVLFTLPSPAQSVVYYSVNGTRFTDHLLEDPVTVRLPTPPDEGDHLTVCYV